MAVDLCRGWTEPDIVAVVEGATDLQRAILRSIAGNYTCNSIDVAADIGVRDWRVVAGALSSWSQHVTGPRGVHDPSTGKESWPFGFERNPAGRDGYAMPPAVAAIVKRLTNGPASLEREHRLDLWTQLVDKGGTKGVSPGQLRELGIYGGAQGIWVDKARTVAATGDSRGATMAILHAGISYADDLYDGGILYHYPSTARPPGRDTAEVDATKATKELDLPLFVVTAPTPGATTRNVDLGWVEAWDDSGRLFLITFADASPTAASQTEDTEERPFELEQPVPNRRVLANVRPSQHQFKFGVLRRYGTHCAVCDVRIARLLDAAHIRGHRDGGSDDPRNGLVLCALHHRAYDAGLFAIEPDTLHVRLRRDLSALADIGINKTSLDHLESKPHPMALSWRWSRWNEARQPQ